MSQPRLYHKIEQKLEELRPGERKTRTRNMALLIMGLYCCRVVYLHRIAEKLWGLNQLASRTKKLSRLLSNQQIRVREWYEPVALHMLSQIAASNTSIRLIIDGSKIGFRHQLLMVAVAYRRRSIPIAWTWVRHQKGHSTAKKQLALLAYVQSLLPGKKQIILVGDAEFGAVDVQKQLEKWHWVYVLRQKGQYHVLPKYKKLGVRIDSLAIAQGQRVWLGECRLTSTHKYRVNLLVYWKRGEKSPWLLATNLPDQKSALRAYKYRMWIEEMFGDFKGHGFDLEATQLRHFQRLSRLTLAVVLLFIWLLALGSQVIKAGKRKFVDRTDRRDFSLFRIGCNWLERCLVNFLPIRISLKLN